MTDRRDEERAAREAAALRENLRRRKAAARAAPAPPAEPAEEAPPEAPAMDPGDAGR